ncbi:biotin-dependent carboxyltransferase family protein [Streptomyces sp. NPDC050418]|uniref:biotin-dependent carboxyltransferase family protein n=1 Tax=Streptomyces sp. NPDC050418 TaxID=3365612 RepID=UPI0037B2D77C
MTDRAVVVVRPGALTTVQDLGRPGHAHLGVPPSGMLDAPAGLLANRLVGNAPEAAVLESTLNGVSLRPRCAVTIAVTGAPCPVTVDGRPAAWGAPVHVPAGALLDVGQATSGVRSYVAVCGGLDVDPVLGSRATDLLSGLGPPPLAPDTVLPLGPALHAPALVDVAPQPSPPAELLLHITFGPRDTWFTPAALDTLTTSTYYVSPTSNRIALRTEGPPLERATPRELPSEGLVTGALQVPPNGHPLLFLADRPTTGGYPVVAVARHTDLAAAAQARPGTPVRFVALGAPSGPAGV